jgi:hypothetical protein
MAHDSKLVVIFKSGAIIELDGEPPRINQILSDYQSEPNRDKPSAIQYITGGRLDVIYADVSGMITKPD